ncbi:MAG: amidohydrolase [Deltaproteobacteria bacterium]|nr:amidohydrolase [Deltaproteobacteria bacterium]
MDAELAAMPVIDIDTHYTEPRDMWTSRAPQKLRDLAPHVVENQGNEQWVVGDLVLGPPGFCVIGKDGKKSYGVISLPRFADMSVASTNPEARLRYMDEFGLHTQILYPNTLGFAGNNMMKINDTELRNFCITGYNDAMAEVQQVGKGRLYPQALLPFWDIELTVNELKRAHDQLGMTGFTMTDSPESWGLPYLNDPHWDPLWAEAQERGMPVNFHIGSGVIPNMWPGLEQNNRGIAAVSTMLFMNNMRCLTQLIFSGLLDRFPRLRFVSVESGIGWVPFMLEACEYQMDQNLLDRGGLKLRPREYFQRQIYASYWFENEDAAHSITKLGADNVMFETDFPHPTCLYPNVREQVQATLGGLERSVQRKVLYETAAKVYNLPLPV